MTKDRQPWMKWIERKLKRVAERWKTKEAMAATPTRKQMDELSKDCFVESTLKTWLEIGGRMREDMRGRKKKNKKREETGFGVEMGNGWIPIEVLTTKQVLRYTYTTTHEAKKIHPE